MNMLAVHLLQSTAFALGAWLVTLALRRNEARVRHGIWMAASVKFLVPFAALVSAGRYMPAPAGLTLVPRRLPFLRREIGRPLPQLPPGVFFSPTDVPLQSGTPLAETGLALVWLAGFTVVLGVWWRRWEGVRAIVRDAAPVLEGREAEALARLRIQADVSLRVSRGAFEPGVFGILRPILLLPADMAERLSDPQLEAILAHEVSHVRRRDNLLAAIHTVVQAMFWFHPLVWWLGVRLVEERERACDESVVRQGSEPQAYAESIVKVCEFYLTAPRVCMSGISGGQLTKRIEEIMMQRISRRLGVGRRVLLGTAAVICAGLPLAIGQAQRTPAFEVASVKPDRTDGRGIHSVDPLSGTVTLRKHGLRDYVRFAYNLQADQVLGGPGWMDSEIYEIVAKAAPRTPPDQLMLMLQGLFAERFKLRFHRETRREPGFALVAAKNGAKLQSADTSPVEKFTAKADDAAMLKGGKPMLAPGHLVAMRADMALFANILRQATGRPVQDLTGLKGTYAIQLEWTPDEGLQGKATGEGEGKAAASAPGPSIFTALQEQLGLRLEGRKIPVEFIVIDHAEKASEN